MEALLGRRLNPGPSYEPVALGVQTSLTEQGSLLVLQVLSVELSLCAKAVVARKVIKAAIEANVKIVYIVRSDL